MEAQLDPIFQKTVDSKRIPGVAAIALDVVGNYLFSNGYGNTVAGDETSPKVTTDTPAMIWSCTKLVTCVAALQLVEQGKINLNDPASKYVPKIKDIQLVKGWNDDGSPVLVAPEKEILVLHLFTHTAGMAYDFFHPDIMKWRVAKNQPPVSYATRSSMEEYTSPLIFEPGSRWEYGVNIDWLGFIVGQVSGLGLAEYIDQHIVQPLGLKNTGLKLSAEQENNFFTVHTKDAEGNLTSTPMRMPEDPEVVAGGHYLYSSCDDYAQFLLALTNGGTHPKSSATLLEPETVKKYIFTDMLPEVGCSNEGVGTIPSTVPAVSSTGEMLPGVSKGWSLGGLVNNESVPNGRSKGSAAWAGLGNCYFWMDPSAGKLGFVVSAVLPFFDKDVLHLADALERAVYGKPMAKEAGESGSNFEGGDSKVDSHELLISSSSKTGW
ncbi:hypothetical protein LTR37_017425 [Vermiconidia calcicola]|uniref:Uncharacterized protein n=1 Tax=Vermiconidia calcicola TaxID=1690605 RepID=A0ACC3MKR6_9PEZI|nr:hypothetical protein LTR37_017425 [Vermiconidia calcicola]